MPPIPTEIPNLTLKTTADTNLRPVKAAYFAFYVAFGLYVAYINVYYRTIGMSGIQIGWISSAIPLVAIASGPVWGMISDRIGRARTLLVIAGIGSLVTILGLSVAREFAWLLPLAALNSLFSGNIPPMLDSVNLGMLGEKRDRYGEQRIWGSMGYILSTLGFGLLLRQVGLHGLFYGYAAVMLIFVTALNLLPNRRVQVPGPVVGDVLKLVLQPQWVVFSVSILLLGLGISGMNNFLGVYLNALGGSATLIGAVASLGALAEIPVMLFSAVLVRRFGLKRLLAFAFVAYALRFVLYSVMAAPAWALAISLMHGLTYGLFWVSSVMYVNHLAADNLQATSQTLLVAVLNLANVIGAPVGGYIFDNAGPASLFRVYAVLCAVGLVVLLLGFRMNSSTITVFS